MTIDALFTCYAPPLTAITFQTTRDWQEAEDIVQEVFLEAIRRIADFDGGAPYAWLNKILYYKTAQWLRSGKRGKRPPPLAEPLRAPVAGHRPGQRPTPRTGYWANTPEPNPEAVVIANESVNECLAILTRAQAQAIEAVILDGCSEKEAASRLGLTTSALRFRVFRGRKRLRECLEASKA